MKVYDIKWDLEDEELNVMEEKRKNNIIKSLPYEVEIPNTLLVGYDGTNFETYYPDISDWLAKKFSCDHYGFKISK